MTKSRYDRSRVGESVGHTFSAPAAPLGGGGVRGVARAAVRRLASSHAAVPLAIYSGLAVWFFHQSVAHLGSVCACSATPDPTQWLWGFVWIPYALTHGLNPLITHAIWTPGGLDLAAVADAPITALPGSPITWLFGPIVAYNVLAIAAPVCGAFSAYRLCLYLTRRSWASIVGGYIYGFSTYELAHAYGHVHLQFVFFPPLLVLVVLKFLDGRLSRRRFVVLLTLLVVVQLLLETEILFTTTLFGAAALMIGWVVGTAEQRQRIIRVLAPIVASYGLAAVICSYYIYLAFRVAPYAKGVGVSYPTDLVSYVVPTQLFWLFGNRLRSISSQFFTHGSSEENAYLGLPLITITLLYLIGHWRERTAKTIAVVMASAFVFSLGDTLYVDGHATLAMPFSLIQNLPLFELVVPARLGLFVTMGAAITAAVWLAGASGRGRFLRWGLAVLALAFLFPNINFAPREARWDDPTFFSTDIYKRYLRQGEIVMPIPFASAIGGTSLLWQAQTDMYFRLASGDWGPPPPSYYRLPIVKEMLAKRPVSPQAPQQLRAFLVQHDVSTVIVDPTQPGPWPRILVQAGWEAKVTVGGVTLYRNGSSTSYSSA